MRSRKWASCPALLAGPRDGAVNAAERIRSTVADTAFQYENKPYKVTVSVGVATTAGDLSLTPSELIRQADEKRYQAKHEGRNRVIA